MANLWVGSGRVVREPKAGFTDTGKLYCFLDLRARSIWHGEHGPEIVTDDISCQCWADLAKLAIDNIHAGDWIEIRGRVRRYKQADRRWETRINVNSIDWPDADKPVTLASPEAEERTDP